ncbi:MAG: sugar phosphate isomerase/epimerase [Lachnospiraceae bacterium]|nr:sugar phosphate isomerase/epimerase [Lachnospiraceae bacterium]
MKSLPVGLQVYSVRDMLEKTPGDFPAVMRQVRWYGYDGVELAGLYGLEPAFIRDTLGEIGLTPISAHVPLSEMMADAEKVARDYKTIGCEYVVVPYLPPEYRHLTDGYGKVLDELRRIGPVMNAHGLRLLYHNHDFEFVKLPDGTYGLDDIYSRVPADALAAEPDVCWIKVAGVDPVGYIGKYAGRCPIVHLKDFIKEGNPKNLYKLIGMDTEEAPDDTGVFEFRSVGFGQQVWEPILEASVRAGAAWVVVEQDESYGLASLECARRSREYLRILGW